MKTTLMPTEKRVLFVPENDLDLFQLGEVFGRAKLPIELSVASSKIKTVAIKTENLWPWIQETTK